MRATSLHTAELHFPSDAVWIERIMDRDVDRSAPAANPHRHDFHEILWIRSGEATHVIDGGVVEVGPGTVLVIARRQAHQYLRGSRVNGAAVRFGEDLARVAAGLSGANVVRRNAGAVYSVPTTDVGALESLLMVVDEEGSGARRRWRQAIERHMLSALFALLADWDEVFTLGASGGISTGDAQLYERFAALLEDRYANERGARFYADALGVPPAVLARVVSATRGQTVKAVILERALTEADRLLKYTDMNVGEVAACVGFDDAFYFSRLFKRHRAVSPIQSRKQAHAVSP